MKLSIFLFLLIMSVLTGCDSGRTRIYSTNDCTENYQRVNFNLIMNSAEKYDSSFVEITGFYYLGFEASVISNSKTGQNEKSMIWVDFRSSLIDSLEKNSNDEHVFEKISGKKIKIIGRVDSKAHGHLDQYAATIEQICYLEVYNW